MSQLLQIVKMLKPYWRYIGQSLLVGILIMVFTIPGPYLTKMLIDNVYPYRDYTLLNYVILLSAVLSLCIAGINFVSGYFGRYIGIHMGFDYQLRFYDHIQRLDFSFYNRQQTGEILSRFRDMRSAISNVITVINTLVINLLYICVFPAILFFINWKLALIAIVILPFDAMLFVASKKIIGKLTGEVASESAKLSAKNYESIQGIRTIQALNLEFSFYNRIENIIRSVENKKINLSLYTGLFALAATSVKVIGTLLYSWYGWVQILNGQLTLGSYMAFTAYIGYLYGPIEKLIGLINQIEVTSVYTNRFLEIYQIKPRISNDDKLPCLKLKGGEIRFNDVCFSYDGDSFILKSINVVFRKKSMVALVGKSGSGKSSLVNLIPRFYDPSSGSIEIDGQDIRRIRLKSLRENIGYVMQGNAVFQGTIYDNLTFGRDIPTTAVEEALQVTYMHDYVASLPRGYMTDIGEQGVQLSEGQKQRIALARVLLLDSRILILDEPTSSIDNESQFYITKALDELRTGRTIIIIAHRMSTIRNADRIFLLEDGEIIEDGSHAFLMENDGKYAKLCKYETVIS